MLFRMLSKITFLLETVRETENASCTSEAHESLV